MENNSIASDIYLNISSEAPTHDRPPGGSVTDQPLYSAGITAMLWGLPHIITLGTIGNIFSFIVMLQREMRQTSTFFYLAVLAVADTIVLFVSAFKTWIRTATGFEMLHVSDLSCKTFMFLTYFSLHLSAWLIVAVTIERFIVVWFPLKATTICSTRRAKLTTLAVAGSLAILNCHLFWTAELVQDLKTGRTVCAMLQTNQFLYKEVMPWLHFTIYCLLPFILLMTFNALIILSLIRHRQMITSQMTRNDKRSRYNHRKLAITLLSVSFVWIATNIPSALYTVIPLHPTTAQQAASQFFIKILCYLFLYLNHAINFLLYCITGQAFRREFAKLICCTCRKKRQPKRRLQFRASRTGSVHDTTTPLMNSGSLLCCGSNRDTFTRETPLGTPPGLQ
ncbi:thyrotropin-releasing hormone receptor-like isoform X2 [Dreissena polymorpha]|uniref:thyrotropin-releasing hormone receptor-like isoform X2 n=1 Tax=Dreissena polymorpha TaxID=45954 RepID=UPI00226562C4|nr:thyrotropin-releasing hormone receptor-like isoform X2 [Dreissena polymorpha]